MRNKEILKEKLRLIILSGRTNLSSKLVNITEEKNLICFMHGPGGSGKSAVIDLLISYAREYTHHLEQVFDSNTIVISAMSGVAATLIGGKTIHSAVHLNKSIINVPRSALEDSKSTRMLR